MSLQNDGDLWQEVWTAIRARGADTVEVTKVKRAREGGISTRRKSKTRGKGGE